MITCKLKGGLGNQLFQIFAVIAYSLRNKKNFKFLYSKQVESITPRHSYWDSFLTSLKSFTLTTLPQMNIVNFKDFEYKEMTLIEDENVMFNGYFQSYKFFQDKQDDIYRLIRLQTQQKECINKYNLDLSNTISMHFRIGDYKKLGFFHPIMGFDYYKNSLTSILSSCPPRPYKILYFCESEDNDIVLNIINELKGVFPVLVFEKASDEIEDWEQMLVMSSCEHNIIANSCSTED